MFNFILGTSLLVPYSINPTHSHSHSHSHPLIRESSPVPHIATAATAPAFPRSVGEVGGRRVWIRPHAEATLRRLLDSGCHVALWSTARENTLRALVRMAIPPDVLPRLAFVWDRRWCTAIKSELLKDLSTVWRHPSLCGAYGPDNTLIVDDSPRKTRRNPPHNTHCMPTFHPRDPDIELMPRSDLYSRISDMRRDDETRGDPIAVGGELPLVAAKAGDDRDGASSRESHHLQSPVGAGESE